MNAQRDELADEIKGYGKSFLGECKEVDVEKIEHSFDCMADGIADYLTEDCGWSRSRTVDSAADFLALPHESVIRDAGGMVFERWYSDEPDKDWTPIGHQDESFIPVLPATVLFTPGSEG